MKHQTIITLVILFYSPYSQGTELTYNEAEQHWLENKETSAYQAYATEFVKYSHAHQLDTRLRCDDLGSESVRQYLVINLGSSRKYAFIAGVVSMSLLPSNYSYH